jgi:hypothetical protein
MFRTILGHLQVIKYKLLEKAIQRKLYNQKYGTNFQRDLFGIHTNEISLKISAIPR